jgi:tetratricopeptide (TPR) repeat protein
MPEAIEQRDFFISFNNADLAYAKAIDAALREAGFTTYFFPNDLLEGGNVAVWMDQALMNSAQTLALFSPDYTKDQAVYSKIERYASLWQDPGNDERKLIPILLRETTFTPLMALLRRIDVTGMTRDDAAAHIVERLKAPLETKQRSYWRIGLPLPKVFNVLYRPNPNFTGRFDAIESLHKSLRQGNAAITAVAGMGGVGKTTLAAEYCHRFGGRYGGVWWVRAEQEPVMLADLAALGLRLGIAATGNIEADAHAALGNLASRTEPWLMVYDNAPNADAVSKWLPAGAVRCLITSRFAGFDSVAAVTKLGQWTDEVTANYLIFRTKRGDKSGALRLAHSLGGLPLAAEQAAAFLRDRKGISFDDYAKEIARLIKEEKPAGAKGDYPDTVYAAFVKSLETAEGTKSGKAALDLIRLCAFLSPDGVDLGLLLADQSSEILPADFAAAITDTFAREDAFASLAALSLLRREEGPAGPLVIFHRLLLDVTRDWMGASARDLWGSVAVQVANAAFPYRAPDPVNWPRCARLMPHIAPLDAYAPRSGAAGKSLSRLLNQASVFLNAHGDRAGAVAMAEKAVALGRETEAENPLNLAAGLINLAGCYADLKRMDDAEVTYGEALAIQEPLLDKNDPVRATTLSYIIDLHLKRKEFVKAEQLCLRAAEIEKAADGPISTGYGTALSNLAAIYSGWADEPGQSTRLAQAQKYATQALTITLATSGPRHPQTATRYHNVAWNKAKQGDPAGAVAEAQRAVAIMLSLGLAQHPNTQLIAQCLVDDWNLAGRPDAATRLRRGDIADLMPVIAQIEAEHRAWVAEDPKNRHFGPPSPFDPSQDRMSQIRAALVKAGFDLDELMRRVEAGELSGEAFNKIVNDSLTTNEG